MGNGKWEMGNVKGHLLGDLTVINFDIFVKNCIEAHKNGYKYVNVQ